MAVLTVKRVTGEPGRLPCSSRHERDRLHHVRVESTGIGCAAQTDRLALEARLRSTEGQMLSELLRPLAIGEVAERAGMSTSRIRYYEARGLLPEPERVAGKRRYTEDVLRRLAIIDAAQRVGFTLEEIRDLLGSRDQPAHERLRQLAVLEATGARRSDRSRDGGAPCAEDVQPL